MLHGTALNVYACHKDWGWGRTKRDGPNISPDSPPWIRRAALERSYSLLHADVGIAADYRKRRYVIRVRAETDQFLLSCIELQTHLRWLEALFAAIDVAAPIDDREFPRDQSIPRIQRLLWYRSRAARARQLQQQQGQENPGLLRIESPGIPQHDEPQFRWLDRLGPVPEEVNAGPVAAEMTAPAPLPRRPPEPDDIDRITPIVEAGPSSSSSSLPPPVVPAPAAGRLSTTSYPNEGVDADTGKWAPRHRWTPTHDMAYAKLCYAVLLFKSPRKSKYIIARGKEWLVDWATGRMVRCQPPSYDEFLFGPWQVVQPESRRI